MNSPIACFFQGMALGIVGMICIVAVAPQGGIARMLSTKSTLEINVQDAGKCRAAGYTPVYGSVSDSVKCDVSRPVSGNVVLKVKDGEIVEICNPAHDSFPGYCRQVFPPKED